jgi:hypothetical protein
VYTKHIYMITTCKRKTQRRRRMLAASGPQARCEHSLSRWKPSKYNTFDATMVRASDTLELARAKCTSPSIRSNPLEPYTLRHIRSGPRPTIRSSPLKPNKLDYYYYYYYYYYYTQNIITDHTNYSKSLINKNRWQLY